VDIGQKLLVDAYSYKGYANLSVEITKVFVNNAGKYTLETNIEYSNCARVCIFVNTTKSYEQVKQIEEALKKGLRVTISGVFKLIPNPNYRSRRTFPYTLSVEKDTQFKVEKIGKAKITLDDFAVSKR